MHIDYVGDNSRSILNRSVHPGRKDGRVPMGTGEYFAFGLTFGHMVEIVWQIENLAPLEIAWLDVGEVAIALFTALDRMEMTSGLSTWSGVAPTCPRWAVGTRPAPYPTRFKRGV